jgi:hypothetical protein
MCYFKLYVCYELILILYDKFNKNRLVVFEWISKGDV